jgi:two-component system response regulator AtoC
MNDQSKVLIIDDEASIRESVEMFLREKGLSVDTAGTGAEGMEAWLKYQPQVIILDIRLPDTSGLEVLKQITGLNSDVKVIMITAYHDMETTIEAMRNGAYDYIHKPLDVDELDHAVQRSLQIAEASRVTPLLESDNREELLRRRIVGRTPAMRTVFKTIGLLSRNRASVLIEGETGTGKELIARVIHESSSDSEQPFVTVDCTTLVENLLESELFGHERGAFTGAVEAKKGRLELAGEGTIFLDEVGDLPFQLQSKLLRFLECREFTPVGSTRSHQSQARA